jgi:hypothetical protein
MYPYKIQQSEAQVSNIKEDTKVKTAQHGKINQDRVVAQHQASINSYTHSQLLPSQKAKVDGDRMLVQQRRISEEAQVRDSIAGIGPVKGILGRQMTLFTEQAKGFQRDGVFKIFKTQTDGYAVRASGDSGTLIPGGMRDPDIEYMYNELKKLI